MSRQTTVNAPTLEFDVHFRSGHRGKQQLANGPAQETAPQREDLPRVTRLLALAHRWNDLLERGEVRDQAEIAGLMGITRARVTQIMNLTFLAPSIQERILDPKARAEGPLAVEVTSRQLCLHPVWSDQLRALHRVEA